MTPFAFTTRQQRLTTAFLLGLLVVFGIATAQADIVGKVVAVTDGDTVKVLTPEKKQHKIRLAEIDAPEHNQDFGKKSKQSLSDLIFGKTVRVVKKDTDRYGRIVGRIYVGDVDVNAAQVERGMAWVYRKYNNDKSLLAAEAEAKENRRGLWADKHAIAPWDYRRRDRARKVGNDAPVTGVQSERATTAGEFQCGSKTKCGEMESCAEATFHLETCGLGRLDGDKDGTPCEALCR